MFENLKVLPQDPLLGLLLKFRSDTRSNKVDLGVGVYKDAKGDTPVLDCVKQAEKKLLASEDTKSYVGPAGNQSFNDNITRLIFGETLSNTFSSRLSALQTPGGCGALRALAELIKRSSPAKANPVVWVSDPTWANHIPLLGDAGLALNTYTYYNEQKHLVMFDQMMETLGQAKEGDVVLLHACCHNPSGADLSVSQWDELVEFLLLKKLIPLVDIAYLGFGKGLLDDAYGARRVVETLPKAMVAVSCSKSFGLYRERVGCALILSKDRNQSTAAHAHLMNIVRGIYSMPPSHGAAIVAEILTTPELNRQWQEELSRMRERIIAIRSSLSEDLKARLGSDRFDFIAKQTGMFSFLGVSEEQVERLASDYGIYMASNSRMNLAGLNENNLEYFCESLIKVLA